MRVASAGAFDDAFSIENSPMPRAAQAMAACVRRPIRSPRNSQLSTATTAGMVDITTPAATAVVMLTPNSMNTENRKLPRKDSRNSRARVRPLIGASSAGLRNHESMATAPMPKRSHASKKIGKTATSGFDRAT
jgi:hypothetical protein